MICKICEYSTEKILSFTTHLQKKHNLSAKDYYDEFLSNDSDERCNNCGGPVNFHTLEYGYRKFCSTICSNKSNEVKNKKKITYQKHYGVDNPSKSKIIKEKKKQTCLKNYGVNNPNQSDIVKKKKNQTCLLKYGVVNPNQSNEIKEKKKHTCLKKYGVEYTHQNNSISQKWKNTCFDLYGYECVLENPSIQEIIRKTCLKKYGVDNYAKTSDFRYLARELMISRRSSEDHFRVPIGKNETRILDEIESHIQIEIERSFLFRGFFIDGYIPSLKIAIEIDEIHHRRKKQKLSDKVRQSELEEYLDCCFIRIDDMQWNENRKWYIELILFLIEQRKI